MKKVCAATLLAFMLIFVFMSAALAQSPQATLAQYVSDLQKNPNDTALRERIIKHVQTMRPAPAIPIEVIKHEGAAEYAFKGAKNGSDFLDAAKEYEKALLIAPWLAVDYFNCGVAYEKAGQFKNAVTQFSLYLVAAPDAKDANAVHKRIGGLEYAAGKAAKESSPQVIAAKKRQTEEEFIRKIDGARYKRYYSSNQEAGHWTIDIRGNRIVQGYIRTRCTHGCQTGVWQQWDETILNGREFALDSNGKRVCSDLKTKAVEKGRISDDGYTITTVECNETRTYNRER
ncbi:MAG: hypothetical protein A4E64_00291 [Syntrophorhabdus sp. PtaU1.Bin058]|nr:MAG: hypothetical protein A4E64_00291 [Syntrophorhabdus sp. PtaU1.Bin058]